MDCGTIRGIWAKISSSSSVASGAALVSSGRATSAQAPRRRIEGGRLPLLRRIAQALLEMARQMQADRGKGGLYHFAGAPDTSWADFARAIMAEAGLPCAINDIPSSDYPTPASRPPARRAPSVSMRAAMCSAVRSAALVMMSRLPA